MIKPRIPVSIEDMRQRLGMRDSAWGSLYDVKAAQQRISDWVIRAAKLRWPNFDPDEMLDIARAYKNAREIWPGFDGICDEIQQAERKAYLKEGAMA